MCRAFPFPRTLQRALMPPCRLERSRKPSKSRVRFRNSRRTAPTWTSSSARSTSKTCRFSTATSRTSSCCRLALRKLVGWSHAATENPQGGGQIFVNGQHFSGTNFELDGTDNQDPILGIIVVNPNLDAIGEAKIALQDYDAESGKATSGIVKVQTKSGSNELPWQWFLLLPQ